jgi:hypothetical protein
VALPSSAPSAWLLQADGRQSVLEFRNRLHIREDQASAWKLGGGIAATLDGCPTLVYGVGFGGITFAQILLPNMSRFRIFRFDGTGDIWGGQFREYKYAGSGGYEAGKPKNWRLYPSGPEPWQLPVHYKPAVTDGGILNFSYTSGSESGGYGEHLYLDEMATGQRQFWGQTAASMPGNAILAGSLVGYLTQPFHRKTGPFESPHPDVHWDNQLGVFGFVKARDTNFNRFQVVIGKELRNNRLDGNTPTDFKGAYFSRDGQSVEIDGSTGAVTGIGQWATNGIWVKEN